MIVIFSDVNLSQGPSNAAGTSLEVGMIAQASFKKKCTVIV